MTIKEIRQELIKKGIDAYVVTHGNRFIGQDVLPEEHKLKKLCGFTGSDGLLVITQEKSYLFVDGRYELQAAQEVWGDDVEIVHQNPQLAKACLFLAEKSIASVGLDFWCVCAAHMAEVKRRFKMLDFIDVGDLVNFNEKREIQIMERDLSFSGQSTQEKLSDVASWLHENKAQYFLMTSADSISWLLNIYARDLPYTPIVRSYALIDDKGEYILFGDDLVWAKGTIQKFRQMTETLGSLGNCCVLYDSHTMPEKMFEFFTDNTTLRKFEDVCRTKKAEKNKVELQGMMNCHTRDGVALVKFLCWLETNYKGKTECDIVEKLHDFRSEQKDFFSESFATIAGSADNSAVVHYQPKDNACRKLAENNLLLIDSGGQYLDGTTDVTRTVVLGLPSAEMIRDFTYVLKAHIALARAKFPQGTAGIKLDTLARSVLWQYGIDYKHGTGHGVGCFGNVHEGPISISVNGSMYGLQENMFTSVEPGYYQKGKYGIRIENLVYTTKVDEKQEDDINFLMFKTLTKVPIDKKLIDKYLLSADEQDWLNQYHQTVYDCLTPYLNESEKKWLEKACSPL